jgi:hypothetical protein
VGRSVTTRVAAAVFGGLMMVTGIAGGIVAHEHHPAVIGGQVQVPGAGTGTGGPLVYVGWSMTAYDVVRIGAWALLIFGAIIVGFSLVREFKARD